MIEKQYHFISGLPRSGSTVLASILSQNQSVFVTPTSPMLDQLIENQNIWHNLQTVKANPIPIQLDNITRRIINGMWQHIDKPIIIDKNRGWGKNMPAAEVLFGKPIKMIAMSRDLPSIMASWLTLLNNNPKNHIDQSLIYQGKNINDETRLNEMWENMVRDCFESLQQALRDARNQVMLINYNDFVENPMYNLKNIEEFLELPACDYNLNYIENKYNDDDLTAWGLDAMHKIRPELKKISQDAQEVIGNELFDKYANIEQSYVLS